MVMTSDWHSAVVLAIGSSIISMALAALALLLRRSSGHRGTEALEIQVEELAKRVQVLESRAAATGLENVRARAVPTMRRFDPPSYGGRPLITVPSLAANGSSTAAIEAAAELGRRFGPIWDLADSGQPPSEIARTTGQPIGQVELILGLRRPDGLGRAVQGG
jgi:hypothetical protein